jgi:hypothetical protein
MPFRDTPGPGGFGPSPAFGHAHQGVRLQLARTHPVPGVHNAPAAVASGHPWTLALALVALLAAVAVAAIVALRRR